MSETAKEKEGRDNAKIDEILKDIAEKLMKKNPKMTQKEAEEAARAIFFRKNKNKETQVFTKLKETETKGVYRFVGASTLPDRTKERLQDGTVIEGEILSKNVLDKMASMINDTSKSGGKLGSYRTISLFHDRVYMQDPTREEAGFVVPGTAKVMEMKDYPGQYQLEVDVKVNEMYCPTAEYPDMTPEKIAYKIENDALGLSIEYNNRPDQEKVVSVGSEKYRYIMDTEDFRGFGFARVNVIGNPTAIRIKEIADAIKKIGNDQGEKMDEAKMKELQAQIDASDAKVKELSAKVKEFETSGNDAKAKELKAQIDQFEAKLKELKLAQDETATKIKESIERAFAGLQFNRPAQNSQQDAKLKEIREAVESKNWNNFKSAADARVKEQEAKFKELFETGFNFEKHQTMKVKCQGRSFVIDTAKTKDVIDTSSMNEATYYQTNAMFADMYVPGIVETFLKSDSLLKAMIKEQHVGGNDKYQWRIWIDFATFTGANTSAVDPNVTSVDRKSRNFLKLETPIREYREGVEVTDFTQYHSNAAVGDLMMQEINRAAEVVTNSLNADLFKAYGDGSTGWNGVNGLLYVAASATYTTLYGRTRSAANRLLDATTANTYDSTDEAISTAILREMYEKVLAQGSTMSDLAIVIHPHQVARLFNTQDNPAATYNPSLISTKPALTMAPADPSWGFKRDVIPYLDGIPMIRDWYCTDASGNGDTAAVIDIGPQGFVLVVSKPIGVRGLAKIGTSESAYVSIWCQAVYKRPRNICLHDDFTALGA